MLGFIALNGGGNGDAEGACEVVGGVLARLPANYDVLQDIVAGSAHLHFVVVSYDRGLFPVHPVPIGGVVSATENRLLVDGLPEERDHIRECGETAAALRRLLQQGGIQPPPVRPLLVPVPGRVPRVGVADGIQVVDVEDLLGVIARAERVGVRAMQFWAQRTVLRDGIAPPRAKTIPAPRTNCRDILLQ